jgi:hypothetical protein
MNAHLTAESTPDLVALLETLAGQHLHGPDPVLAAAVALVETNRVVDVLIDRHPDLIRTVDEWALDLDADETLTDAIIREARQFA